MREEDFNIIVAKYMDRIYSFTYRLSGDASVAEDSTQETFVKVWKNLKKFDTEMDMRPWLFSIARNATIDILRKKRDLTFSDIETPDDDFGQDIADENILADRALENKITKEILEKTMESLSVDQRTAVILHDLEDMIFEEMAQVTGKPLNTVKSHYRRAIMALRDKLAGTSL